MSSAGRLCFGFNGDAATLADLPTLRDAAREELDVLVEVASAAGSAA